MRKFFLSLLFVIFVGPGLSACGGGGSAGDGSGGNANQAGDSANQIDGNESQELQQAVATETLTLPSKLEVVTNEN
ncbi:hypothetical protein [Agaribacterium haliotis]|uniref:hypothetical protein n=1 Tax=Agaribacterium haliotis TaxID=2013869 RepID=UPI000BB573A4|nr:hypothetical protein [Agaribacterium haliotis]